MNARGLVESEASVTTKPPRKALRVVIFIIVIAVILAIPIWLGTGPVVLSP